MALHSDLPIHKTGCNLVALAYDVQKNMPRGFKNTLGKEITGYCTEMLVLMAEANACRGAERADCIRNLLKRQHITTVLLRVCHDSHFISHKLWADSMVLLDGIGKQGGGWLKSTKAPAA